jgi:hypothetical protein
VPTAAHDPGSQRLAAGQGSRRRRPAAPGHLNLKTGEHLHWRTPIPGLAHSSPIVWGDRVFVTTAVSTDPKATFKPGLYGDGDASKDRSSHRWMLYALDAKTGKALWRIGRSSKITAPTPFAADDLLVVASGRAPERPIFVIRAGSRGDLTLNEGRPAVRPLPGRARAAARTCRRRSSIREFSTCWRTTGCSTPTI